MSRVSTNARFRIECEGDVPSGLPAELCVKGYFADCSESGGRQPDGRRARGLVLPRTSPATAGVRTFECFYADVDPVTQHGVVITEDVAAHGATFLDALSPYTADQVAESLEQYAILHGRTWESGRTDEPWLAPRLEMTMRARGLPEINGNFEGPIGSRVPEEVRDGERLLEAVRRLAATLWTGQSHGACSTATRTSGTSTSTRQGSRAWSIGSSSSVARGTSTWATTSAAH